MIYRIGMSATPTGHLAPVVIVPHHVGPDGWRAALGVVADALDQKPSLPLTVRVPGAALDDLVASDQATWERLRGHEVAWLAGGWSDAVLADLPLAASRRQLTREKTALDAAGIEPVGLWTGDGWERYMASFAIEAGYRLIYLDAALIEGSPDRPGATDRAGDTVVVVPVAQEPPEMPAGDGMWAVRVRPGELVRFCEENPGRLVTPDRYLVDHLPGERLVPVVTVPERSGDAEVFYRKLLGVIRDQSERSTGADLVLGLESREFTTGDGGGGDAHHQLLEARVAVDRARSRGDAWVRVDEIDWDGDGIDEIQVETAAATLVVDPAASQIAVWDDKRHAWPVTAVTPATPGLITRRIAEDATEPTPVPLRLERRTEGRAEARLTLVDSIGGQYRLILSDTALTVRLTPAATDPMRLGPELPVLLDPNRTRLRVDGGDWLPTAEPVAASGHRFRLTDGDRTLLVSSPRPCDLFVTPLPGRGLVLWPHWPTVGAAAYQVTFDPQ
jgi:hypothetical protein